MTKLVNCSKCDTGRPQYHSETNQFKCNRCDNSAPNSYGGHVDDAARAWNDCNTPARTMADVMAENEELREDILKTVIDSGEVLKHHTMMMAQLESLHYTLAAAKNALLNQDSRPEFIDQIERALNQTPSQSLNVIEAGAIRKAAHKLCVGLTGKKLASHTALIKYAEQLEQTK